MKTVKSKVFVKFINDLTNRKFVRTKEQVIKTMIGFAMEHLELSSTEVERILDSHAQVRASWKFARDDEEIVGFVILDFAREFLNEVKKTKGEEFILETQEAESLINNFMDEEVAVK